jgi:hypothetical protein
MSRSASTSSLRLSTPPPLDPVGDSVNKVNNDVAQGEGASVHS